MALKFVTTFQEVEENVNYLRSELQRKDIDAVVIATPDHWHAVNTVMSANAGKHVYCEKPLAHSIEEGRAMVNAMKEIKALPKSSSKEILIEMAEDWRPYRSIAAMLLWHHYIKTRNIKL